MWPFASKLPTVTSERFVHLNPQVGVVAKLDWRAINSDSKINSRSGIKSIRTEAKAVGGEDSAELFVAVSAGQSRRSAGFFSATNIEESAVLPAQLVSLAAAFIAYLPEDEHTSAALVWVLEASEHEPGVPRAAYVLVDNGVVKIDTIDALQTVIERLRGVIHVYASETLTELEQAQLVTMRQLSEYFEQARLRPVPADWVPMVVTAMVATVLVAGGALSYGRYQQIQKEKADALARARDPQLLYSNALKAVERTLFMAPTAWDEVLSQMKGAEAVPIGVKGWYANSIACSARTGQRTTTWVRQGGTLDELRALLPKQIVTPTGADKGEPQHATAISTTGCTATLGTFPAMEEQRLKSKASALESNLSFEQDMITAKFVVAIQPPAIFPAIDGDTSQLLSHPRALLRGDYALVGVPIIFASSVLERLPANIAIETLAISLAPPGGDAKTNATIAMKGYYYVKP
jgi:hypothetical protein